MFNFLGFGKSNPTHSWPPRGEQSLTFDLDAGSLNHCELGQPLESLSFLGPDEGRLFRSGFFCYYSLGIGVDCDFREYMIDTYQIVLRDPDEPKYQSFQGCVIGNGHTVDLSTLTLDKCEQELGEYFWLDQDEEESIVFYEFPGLEWELEFDATGFLNRLILTNDPLLADEKQRKAYNISKPWEY